MNEDSGKGYGCFVMLVSGVSMVFSVVALLRHDNWDCEISPSGFVIATLSALITFLVAWNIWKTIDSKNEIQHAKAEASKARRLANRCSNDIKMLRIQHLGVIKHVQGEVELSEGRYYDACISFIDAAKEYAEARNSAEFYISVCLGKIEMCLNKPENVKNVKSDSQIRDMINRITNLDSIVGNANSVQRLNKKNIAKIKAKLEDLLK